MNTTPMEAHNYNPVTKGWGGGGCVTRPAGDGGHEVVGLVDAVDGGQAAGHRGQEVAWASHGEHKGRFTSRLGFVCGDVCTHSCV